MHLIYRLTPAEYHRYKTHLLCLDEESKYLRFGHHIKTDSIKQLFERWISEPEKHIIFCIENEDLEIVAAGHISLQDDPVELAFSVFKEYQRQGMGNALMQRCIEYCQNRGIKSGCMVCLNSNDAIKKLAKKHGLLINDGTDSMAEITIPNASPMTYINEAVNNNISAFDHLGKAQRKFIKMLKYQLRL